MIEPLLFWSLAIVGVSLTGISKSGFAGGAGVVAVPLLALVIPVESAISLMLPLLLLMDIRAVKLYWQHLDKARLYYLLPSAIVGVVAGGWLLGSVSESFLQGLLALLCIGFATWQPLLKRLNRLKQFAYVWGFLSGLSSTLIHAGGPPINAYLMTLNLPKLKWLATASVFFALLNVIKLVPYSLAGIWQRDLLVYSLLLAPIAWLGIGLGNRIQHQLSEQQFMRVCRGLLLATGVMLLLKSLL